MTDKTIDELFQKQIDDLLPLKLAEHEVEELKSWFLYGYQSALQPKWIKLPELPKEEGRFLVTTNNTNGNTTNLSYFSLVTHWDIEKASVLRVIAWMPLPQPFSESEDK